MPKISALNGPTHAGHNPPAFGAALAAARSEPDEVSAVEGTAEPIGVCPVCHGDVIGVSHGVAVEVGHEPSGGWLTHTVEAGSHYTRYKPCQHLLAMCAHRGTAPDEIAFYVGENGPVVGDAGPDPVDSTEPEGGEQPSPGSRSSTSPKRRQPNSGTGTQPSRSRAGTTASPSKRGRKAASTAASAVGETTNSNPDDEA